MWPVVKRLSLGLTLIVMTSAVLLVSDQHNRSASGDDGRRVALVSFASTLIFEEGERGLMDGLEAAGYRAGNRMELVRYNAEADMAMVNTIAREVVGGGFDLVITLGTPALQAVANANRAGRVTHVYGLVADATRSGVGVSATDPYDHPPHLVGVSSFIPSTEAFIPARQMLPSLQRIGLVWNSAEANSAIFTADARVTSGEMGIELLEANTENSAGVGEAAASLIARGAQALWVSGDSTVQQGIGALIRAASQARIPVFTFQPGDVDQGALFDVGLNFHETGLELAQRVAQVLDGAAPAGIPSANVFSRTLLINTLALANLREPWQIPPDILARAAVVVDENGRHERTTSDAAGSRALSRTWRLSFVQYNNVIDVEEAERGTRDGLKEAGLVEGRDYEVTVRNAQGDMATVNGLIDAALVEGTDMLVTFSTPTLQAAIQRARAVPIVFTYVANAVIAGAGTSDTDHLPNVTGVYTEGAYDEMMALIREAVPSARVLGTLFVPAEVNTVYHRDKLADAAGRAGMEVVSVAANTASDVADAALALVARRIDVVCQIPGNLTASAFPAIAQAARRARLPSFGFQTSQLQAGAVAVLARDYHDGGREAALLAARVMRGESPATIPFVPVSRTRLMVNPGAARDIGFAMPPSVLERAEVYSPASEAARPVSAR